MMIKQSVAALALVCCMFGAAASDVQNYSSKEHSFSFQYPAKWEKKDRISGTAVTVLAPKGDGKDAFRANANVIEQDIPADTDLKKFADASLSVMDKLLEDYKEVERKEITIGTTQAVRVTYTHTFEKIPVKSILVLAVKGKSGYAITCGAEVAVFDTFKQPFDDIINSFAPSK
ncbi:MAG: PsbP-related protein [Planctomycetota bacterium]